jgi:large subunit ribosomal protein L44
LPRQVEPTEEKPELKYLAIGEAVRALVGLVYERQGLPAATALVKRHFASRSLDFDGLVKLLDPLRALRETVVRFGLERPVARLLVESGRLSATPTYVIGIFSGDIKLGEGSGSKILEAQRAVRTRPALSSLSSYHTCLC